eukprot:COSAG02_NODE_398_length_23118_cov_49.968939_7_plen_38_part_00
MRLPKDRRASRVEIEPDTTRDTSLATHGTYPLTQHMT